MQNKDFRKIENQGWKQMQQMLEKELPGEKPKRRIVPWFWWSGMAAVVALAAVLFITKYDTSHQVTKIAVDDKVEEITPVPNTKINNKAFEILKNEEISGKIITVQNEVISEKASIVQEEEISPIEIINSNINTADIIKPILSKKHTTTNNIDKKVYDQYQDFISETSALSCPSPNISSKPKTFEAAENIEKLPTRYADLVSDFSIKPLMKPAVLKTIKPLEESKAKAQWAMNFGVLSTTQPRIHGGAIGVEVQFPLSKKWSLKTGLNYRLVHLEKVFVNASAAEKAFGLQDDVLGVGFNNDTLAPSGITSQELDAAAYNSSSQTFEFRISDNYHFVSIPIEAHFQIKSHGIWVGAETSYLLNADQQNSAANLRWASQDLNNDPNFSYNNDSAPSVPRTDLGFTVGYEYNFNQKIGLNVSYHHGNILQQNDWHLDNRFFKLGANYKL